MTITIEFEVEHSPGNESHLKQIVEAYFKSKGIVIKDGVIRI